VVKRFVSAGIDPTLLVGAGFGEYHPIGPNNTPEGKAANRRVSIVVVSPLEGNDPARSRLIGSEDHNDAPASPAPTSTAQAPAAPAPQPLAAPPAATPVVKAPTAAAPAAPPPAATPAPPASPPAAPAR